MFLDCRVLRKSTGGPVQAGPPSGPGYGGGLGKAQPVPMECHLWPAFGKQNPSHKYSVFPFLNVKTIAFICKYHKDV